MRISDWSSDVCSSDLTVCRGATFRLAENSPLAAPTERSSCTERLGTNACKVSSKRRPPPDCDSRCTVGFQPPDTSSASQAISPPSPACACPARSEETTSELQSLMRISYAVFGLKKKQ